MITLISIHLQSSRFLAKPTFNFGLLVLLKSFMVLEVITIERTTGTLDYLFGL